MDWGLQGEARQTPTSTLARAAMKRQELPGRLSSLFPFAGMAWGRESGLLATRGFAVAWPPLPSLWNGAWNWGRPWQRASSSTCGTSRLTTPAWLTAGWWCGWTAEISIGEWERLLAAWCASASGDPSICRRPVHGHQGNAAANERASLSVILCARCEMLESKLVRVVK